MVETEGSGVSVGCDFPDGKKVQMLLARYSLEH